MKKLFTLLMMFTLLTQVEAQQKVNVKKIDDSNTQKQLVDELKENIDIQASIINELYDQVAELENQLKSIPDIKSLQHSLSNAAPNPSADKSVLEYFADSKAENAYLIVYDYRQQIIKEYPLDLGVKGYIQINSRSLENGTYICSLVINNVRFETTRLLVSH